MLLTCVFSEENSAFPLEEWVLAFKVFTTATRKVRVKHWCSRGHPARRLHGVIGSAFRLAASPPPPSPPHSLPYPRCQNTVTGRGSEFNMRLRSQCGSTSTCRSKAVHEIHTACSWSVKQIRDKLARKKNNNKQTDKKTSKQTKEKQPARQPLPRLSCPALPTLLQWTVMEGQHSATMLFSCLSSLLIKAINIHFF